MSLDIYSNAFYITGASVTDNKRKIVSLCEDKLLFGDSSAINKAQEELLNPQKRLLAEITWFSDCSDEQIKKILTYFEELKTNPNKKHIYVDVDTGILINLKTNYNKEHYENEERYRKWKKDGIASESDLNVFIKRLEFEKSYDKWVKEGITTKSDLVKFNIRFYSLPYFLMRKYDNLSDAIAPINEIFLSFKCLNKNTIKEEINKNREISFFPLLQETSGIEQALEMYRIELKKIFSLFFSENDINYAAEIATSLMEKNKTTHLLLEDFMSEYEIFTVSSIEKIQDEIIGEIDRIIKDEAWRGSNLESYVNNILLPLVKSWDKIAQPLQLLARERGTVHHGSLLLGKSIRALALYCHNKAERTDLAITITNELKNIFAELPEFSLLLKEDEITLHKIGKQKEFYKKLEEERTKNARSDIIWALLSNKFVVNILLWGIIVLIGCIISECN